MWGRSRSSIRRGAVGVRARAGRAKLERRTSQIDTFDPDIAADRRSSPLQLLSNRRRPYNRRSTNVISPYAGSTHDKHLQHNALLGYTWFHSIVWFQPGLHLLFSFCLDIVLSLPQPAFSPFHVGGAPYHVRSCLGCVVHRQS